MNMIRLSFNFFLLSLIAIIRKLKLFNYYSNNKVEFELIIYYDIVNINIFDAIIYINISIV